MFKPRLEPCAAGAGPVVIQGLHGSSEFRLFKISEACLADKPQAPE